MTKPHDFVDLLSSLTGLSRDTVNGLGGPNGREVLIDSLWAAARQQNHPVLTADPVYVSHDPFTDDKIVYERKQYGSAIVIEAEGRIVERLCN